MAYQRPLNEADRQALRLARNSWRMGAVSSEWSVDRGKPQTQSDESVKPNIAPDRLQPPPIRLDSVHAEQGMSIPLCSSWAAATAPG